jgi:hypothetical protein
VNAIRLAIVPLCVALCAALAALVAIDVLGDVLLAHDTFDDIAHGSRVLVGSGALALALVAAGCGLRALLRDARGSETTFCASLAATIPRRPLPFFAAVFVATPAILAGMEALDACLASQSIDDAGDLFGGSLALGLGVAAFAACVSACLARVALRRLARARRSIVRILDGAPANGRIRASRHAAARALALRDPHAPRRPRAAAPGRSRSHALSDVARR